MQKVSFYCSYINTLFRNEKNNYTIFAVQCGLDMAMYENSRGNIICKGSIPIYIKNMPLKISGNLYLNKNKEYEIKVEEIKEEVNSEKVAKEYLIKSCQGIGKATAKKIIDKLGYNIYAYTRENLSEIITEEKANEIIKILEVTRIQREIFEFIVNYGCSYLDAIKIFKELGNTALIEIRKNPYITHLPFSVKEKMAIDLNIEFFDKIRINGIIDEIFSKDLGHTYIDIDYLSELLRYIERISPYNSNIPIGLLLNEIYKSKRFVIEKNEPNRIFRKDLWLAEKNIAKNIKRLNRSKEKYFMKNEILSQIEVENNVKYDDIQGNTINSILSSSGFKILTGGPGTGKTTTINGIIKSYKIMFPENKISLCAPTGRAAQRMTEATDMEALTIHRTVNYKIEDDVITHLNEENQLDADLIIIDEGSMVDVYILNILLSAIKNHSLVILVGDEDQLPSVGAGNILHDLIDSQKIEAYRLERIFRQSEESSIVSNCYKIKNGEYNLKCEKDFEIINVSTEKEIIKEVLKQTKKYYKDNDPFYLQFLSPSKKGDAGVFNINKILQETINNTHNRSIVYGNNVFKVNDKILLTRNNYELDESYYNGDIGIITDIVDGNLFINIGGKNIILEKENLEDVTLSYDMTIHKSQGSEYPVVIIILPEQPKVMLQRKLLFTAISRAKEKVIIISQNNALKESIDNISSNERKTSLKDKIIGNLSMILNNIKK